MLELTIIFQEANTPKILKIFTTLMIHVNQDCFRKAELKNNDPQTNIVLLIALFTILMSRATSCLHKFTPAFIAHIDAAARKCFGYRPVVNHRTGFKLFKCVLTITKSSRSINLFHYITGDGPLVHLRWITTYSIQVDNLETSQTTSPQK